MKMPLTGLRVYCGLWPGSSHQAEMAVAAWVMQTCRSQHSGPGEPRPLKEAG